MAGAAADESSSSSPRDHLLSELQKQAQQVHDLVPKDPNEFTGDVMKFDSAGKVMGHLASDYERKRLFVCCDGTWNNASGTVAPMTNVAKLARAVYRTGHDEFHLPTSLRKRQDSFTEDHRYGVVRQIVYYSSGIGAQSSLAVDSLFSGATGKGIDASILAAYCFICNNFNRRSCLDEIILVGFSRGGFTVRCLAHFIARIGLLRQKALVFLRPLYISWKASSEGKPNNLKQELEILDNFCIKGIKIKVLAEWDTVSALKSWKPWKKKLAFVKDEVPANVENAFHAVAINEKRRSFKPMLWQNRANASTTVKQCAFVGCHSDVGGGNKDPGLSTLSLLWMISQIETVSKANFDRETLLQFHTPVQDRQALSGCIPWPLGKPVMSIHHLTRTKERIHESQKGLWLIAHYLSLGLVDGKRDVLFHRNAQLSTLNTLNIHFTARLLQGRLRLNVSLPEETIIDAEKKLLDAWIKAASTQKGEREANERRVAFWRYLSSAWKRYENKDAGADALISLIQAEFEGQA